MFAPFLPPMHSESGTNNTEGVHYNTFLVYKDINDPAIARNCYQNGHLITIRVRECSLPRKLHNSSYALINSSHLVTKIDNLTHAIICYSSDDTPVICATQTLQNPDQQKTLLVIQAIGITLDIGSCIVYIGTFMVFSDMRTIFGKLVINLIVVILFGDVLYLMSLTAPEEDSSTERYCEATAVLTHFMYLARFVWMTVLTAYVGKTFYSAWQMHQPNKDKKKNAITLCQGMSLGYGVPGVIVAVCICINYTVTNSVRYGRTPFGNCWISNSMAIYLAYMTPISISILINLMLSIFSIAVLVMIRKNATKKAREIRHLLQDCRIVFGIYSTMGITWVFAFLALVDDVMSWAWYPFVILSTSQATILSIAFLAKKDVFDFYSNKFSTMSSSIRQSVRKRLSLRSTSTSSARSMQSVAQMNKAQDKSLSNVEGGSLDFSQSNGNSVDSRKESVSSSTEGLPSPSTSSAQALEVDLVE